MHYNSYLEYQRGFQKINVGVRIYGYMQVIASCLEVALYRLSCHAKRVWLFLGPLFVEKNGYSRVYNYRGSYNQLSYGVTNPLRLLAAQSPMPTPIMGMGLYRSITTCRTCQTECHGVLVYKCGQINMKVYLYDSSY